MNADTEAKIFEGQYWIYPTYSAPYDEQVHMDAWSSKTWYTGLSTPILLIPPT
ncbi:hypothetical protein HDF18_07390 [Mucilaginibacter sp. X5P1]|uniref:hypothetical protein n=1 Tax=Mucilaginibacter sp. X5P1 TaxID=2723088 RepID=UPI00160CC73F|nr:hypothetical protein [Mucilaginibacter sp. X5P1]